MLNIITITMLVLKKKKLLRPEVRHPPISTFYFFQRSHGGILEPTDCSFLPTLDCCDTHTHACTHTNTHTHTPALTGGSDIHSHTGRHPLSIENTQSPFTLQNPHTPRPVCSATLHQHTRAPAHARSDTHTHTSQRAPRLIAPPLGWFHLFHTFCRWLTGKLLRAGGAGRPHDGSACPDLFKTCVMTCDLTKHLSLVQPHSSNRGSFDDVRTVWL